MDIKTIHKTTLFSIEKILAKNDLREIQIINNKEWNDLRRRLEGIRSCSDYFLALRMADELIKDVTKFIKNKRRHVYGKISRGD